MLENENLRQGYDTIRHRPQTLLCLILHSHAASLCQKIWQSYAKKHTFIALNRMPDVIHSADLFLF